MSVVILVMTARGFSLAAREWRFIILILLFFSYIIFFGEF